MKAGEVITMIGKGAGVIVSAIPGAGPYASFISAIFELGAGLADAGATPEDIRRIDPAATLQLHAERRARNEDRIRKKFHVVPPDSAPDTLPDTERPPGSDIYEDEEGA